MIRWLLNVAVWPLQLTFKLFSILVVPGVVWSKLNVGLTVPSMTRLLDALPLRPPETVLTTGPLIERVVAPIASLPAANIVVPEASRIRLSVRVTV